MLDGYFDSSTTEKEKRLLAVQAALEIARASATSSTASTGGKMSSDLSWAREEVNKLADAIQEALAK